MAKKLIAQPIACDDADAGPLCPGCGEPMHPMPEDEEFSARMEMISEAVEGAEAFDIILMLAMAAGSDIGAYTTAKARKESRAEFIKIMDDTIRDCAAMFARHKREDRAAQRAIRRAGSQPALMPDVSDRMQ